MNTQQLHFSTAPTIAPALLKALLMPRKGFNSQQGLPPLEAHWQNATVDKGKLDHYLALLAIAPASTLPILYPHVLAGSMHMHLLTHRDFPIRLLGAVHLKNRIIQQQAISIDAVMDIHSKMAAYRITEKGLEFDFTTEINVAGQQQWHETTTYFKAGPFSRHDPVSSDNSFELNKLEHANKIAEWAIPKNRGKRYAKITGDYNPIHMSSLLAKLFGFKRDIAHGFGVLAQALDQASKHNENINHDAINHQITQVDVIFKGPVYLESKVNLQQGKALNDSRFDAYCGENPKPSICLAITNTQV
ncbi:MaoC/PaaZ C-terminal domain-containing protein [Dasania marina]|uniref:MaoC/PaaZ C-terminal domain-containing protein n=1 Tax=Dasania marina TaxID=471499 RepID=UPI0003822FF7|nr:MaoC/PaaZ C-terminal domain-containing protein [Dasania marina]